MYTQSSTQDQVVKLADTATTQIQYTKYANGTGDLRKHFGLVPETLTLKLLSSGSMVLYEGEATTETVTGMNGFAKAIAKFGPNEAYGQGTFTGLKPGERTQIVSRKHLSANPGARARLKEGFAGSPDLRMRLADIDGNAKGEVTTQADLVKHLTDFDPQFATCGWVRSDSSKSHIWTTEGEQVTGEGNFHWAFPAYGPDDTFVDRYAAWSWYKNLGYFRLSKFGAIYDSEGNFCEHRIPAVLERHLLDLSVFDLSRLIFEAPPKLASGLESRRPAPSFAEGTIVDFTKLPVLTKQQKKIAQGHKSLALSIIRRERYELVKAQIAESTGKTGVALKAHINKVLEESDAGTISADRMIRLADGTELRFGDLNSSHDGIRCESIDEPEVGFATCSVYFDKGVARIHDFHLNKTYKSNQKHEPTSVAELVKRINSQFSVKIDYHDFSQEVVESVAERLMRNLEHKKQATVYLTGNKGSGKTKFGNALLEVLAAGYEAVGDRFRVTSILPLISLASAYCSAVANLGAVHISPKSTLSHNFLFRVLCMMSAGKAHYDADVLVIDEILPSLNQLVNSSLPGNSRSSLIASVGIAISTAKAVVISDADLNDDLVEFIAALRPEAEVIRADNRVTNLACAVKRFVGKNAQDRLHAELIRQLEKLGADQVLVFSTDSLSQSEVIGLTVENLGYKPLIVNSKRQSTYSGEEKALYDLVLSASDNTFPELIRLGFKILVHSPSIATGSSFEGHTEMVPAVFGDFGGGSYSPTQAAQSLSRVRNNAPRFVYAENIGCNFSKFTWVTDYVEILDAIEDNAKRGLDYLRENVTGNVLLEELDIEIDAEGHRTISLCDREIEDYDRTNPWNRLQAKFIAQQNVGMRSFGNEVEALLVVSGCEVEHIEETDTPPEELKAQQDLKARAKFAAKLAAVEALVQAEAIPEGDERLTSIRQRAAIGDLDPGEQEILERHLLVSFFALDPADNDSVAEIAAEGWDKLRSTVNRIETVLGVDRLEAERKSLKSLVKSGGQGILDNSFGLGQAASDLGLGAILRQVIDNPGIRVSQIEGLDDVTLEAQCNPELLNDLLSYHKRRNNGVSRLSSAELTHAILRGCGLKLKRVGEGRGEDTEYSVVLGTKTAAPILRAAIIARQKRREDKALANLVVLTDSDDEFTFEF